MPPEITHGSPLRGHPYLGVWTMLGGGKLSGFLTLQPSAGLAKRRRSRSCGSMAGDGLDME